MTFDPFMYLSVPIPIRNEKLVAVLFLPRIRKRDIAEALVGDEGGNRGSGEGMQPLTRSPRPMIGWIDGLVDRWIGGPMIGESLIGGLLIGWIDGLVGTLLGTVLLAMPGGQSAWLSRDVRRRAVGF